MNYSEFQKLVLMLLEQYSAGGTPVEPSYNGQVDDLCRIPGFFNTALMSIYTRAVPVTRVAQLHPAEELGQYVKYPLPEDCFRLHTGGIFCIREGKTQKAFHWQPFGRDALLLPSLPGEYFVSYCPYPQRLSDPVTEDTVLPHPPHVVDAAAFYCAAMLALHRDPHAYAALMNEFEARIQAMDGGIRAQLGTVEDVMGGAGA